MLYYLNGLLQYVDLLALTQHPTLIMLMSVVRIHPLPPILSDTYIIIPPLSTRSYCENIGILPGQRPDLALPATVLAYAADHAPADYEIPRARLSRTYPDNGWRLFPYTATKRCYTLSVAACLCR